MYGGWPPKNPPIGTGEGEAPLAPPPAPKIDIRTMQSDVRSMQESGGGTPQPYAPKAAAPTVNMAPPKPPEPTRSPFQPPQISNSPAMMPSAASRGPAPTPRKKSRAGLWVVIIILILAALAAGWYFFFPTLFSSPAVTPAPVAPAPVTSTPPVATPAPTPPAVHLTFFKTPADATTEMTLTAVTLPNIRSSIPWLTAATSTFNEIVFKWGSGTLVSFQDLAAQLFPTVLTPDLTSQFESDFTFFTLTNNRGTWPGLVAKLKSGVSPASMASSVQAFESSTDILNLFLQTPGSAQAWKSGQTGIASNRYATFAMPGAAFNYGWYNGYLVLSASYDGFKEAVSRTQ